ncbi:major facilitator superfamily multidrug-resistance, DHA1 sub-family [Mycena sp. CBHHK59/15]|nr:major facilitator superfamily multidrug-resistance, DHA1 sub-family [Mycena sp. CBHHK59/15]
MSETMAAKPSAPLPKFQLTIAILIQSAEALSATVIFPFVPQFVQDTGITGGDERKTGYWAGVLESVFFIAEFFSVYSWGRASDHFGRRPVLLLGPLGLAFSLIGFGWSKTFWSLVVFRCLQGVFNGNIGVVKTVMVEIADPSNLAQVMSFVPLAWSSGSTLGPIIGGLLSNPEERWPDTLGKLQLLRENPYLLPCATVGLLSLIFFFIALVGFKESSPMELQRRRRQKLRKSASVDPVSSDATLTTRLIAGDELTYGSTVSDSRSLRDDRGMGADEEPPSVRELLVPRLLIPLLNYGFFCFSQTAYQVLFPLMYSTSIPNGGLGFSPYQIGVTRGIWGVMNSLTQVFVAARVIKHFGARNIYIFAFANFTICIGAYPLLSFFAQRAQKVDGTVWAIVAVQLLSNLLISMSYSSVQLYIVSSCPKPLALSSTNSLAQMVSTVLRSLAPVIASSLFSVSLEWHIAGGYMVYLALLAIVALGICASFLLPKDL